MVNLTHRYPIAIDLSCPEEISAVQIALNGGAPCVKAMTQRLSEDEAGSPSEDDRIDFIRTVLGSGGFKGKSVALLPPLDMILSYPLRVEIGKQESLEEGIVREAAGALGFPLEEAVIDYASVLPDPGGARNVNEVLMIAARSEDVNRCMQQVQKAGGSLEILESAATALVRVHTAAKALDNSLALLCNVGRQRSEMVVVSRDGMVAHRNVNWGTNILRRKLAENLELGNRERDANFLLRNHGLEDALPSTGESDPLQSGAGAFGSTAQLVSPLVDAFIHELRSVTGYVRSRAATIAFEGVFLYGDGASVRGLDGYVQEELGMQTKAMDPFKGIGVWDTCSAPDGMSRGSYALALGLALRRFQWL